MESRAASGAEAGGSPQDELQDAYLSELLSYSLEHLSKEPELLRTEAERIQRQMQEVAIGHYRAFIAAAEAVQSIRKEIAKVDLHLESLIQEVPKLTNGCNQFMEDAQITVEKRRLNRTMLATQPTLLDLLEIPQLMDTCVRNGNYDEALDLEAFVSKLATMHAKLPVIQALAEDVRQITQSMLSQLLQRLRSSIQLPECLRVIGYLRRLAVFTEHEMRLQFLRCREAWLTDIVEELDKSSPYDYLKRMTDCHRVHLFDVVMQYRAIFSDDTSGLEERGDGGLIYSWAMHRITSYLSVLKAVLPKITDGGSLASVLEHCMYCGMSLGRVGLDFRGLLPPLFEACMRDLFVRCLGAALESSQQVLDLHRWVPLPAMGSGLRSSAGNDSSDDVAPPYSLMEHPPLAVFVNGVLAALNELRHCAPIALRGQLAKELQKTLENVSFSLVRYHQTQILRDPEQQLFSSTCRAFVEPTVADPAEAAAVLVSSLTSDFPRCVATTHCFQVACPYVILCFSRCYPCAQTLVDTGAISQPVQKLIQASLPPQAADKDRQHRQEAAHQSAATSSSSLGSGQNGSEAQEADGTGHDRRDADRGSAENGHRGQDGSRDAVAASLPTELQETAVATRADLGGSANHLTSGKLPVKLGGTLPAMPAAKPPPAAPRPRSAQIGGPSMAAATQQVVKDAGAASDERPVSVAAPPALPLPPPAATAPRGLLQDLISRTRACWYQPVEFFVAWQGVLTVIYQGIPPAFEELKLAIEGLSPAVVRENPGSKWPKTSLACLRDGARLSPYQLVALRHICRQAPPALSCIGCTLSGGGQAVGDTPSARMAHAGLQKWSAELKLEENAALAAAPPILVDKLSVVTYESCCLDRTLVVADVALALPVDPRPPTRAQQEAVRAVADEFAPANLDNYWFHASKDGETALLKQLTLERNRSQHYRVPGLGSTIVHFLSHSPLALARFRARVDDMLPGMYDWFSEGSLHITLRAIT
eukprot:SM000010S04352  [mRNA]  locus=s10:1079419:1087306:+ [translate_table: standard]